MYNKVNRKCRIFTTTLLSAVIAHNMAYAQEQKSIEENKDDLAFESIVVTANKRTGGLRTIAGSVSALTGEQLAKAGAESLSDYINRLPGVHFNDYQPGVSEVVIRGVSSTTYHEQGQTTVGYYINDIPLSEAGWPIVIPDVDTFDLQRVEVLRGPQGTLYGSATLGGLVNYIAKEADVDGYDAAFETSLGSTKNAGEANYSVKGMFNAPLIDDKLALRVVAINRFEAGFLDNVGTDKEGVNDVNVTGVRGSLVYTPSNDTKVVLTSMYQKTKLDDQTYSISPTLTRDTAVAEPHETEFTLHSLRVEQDLGFADLTLLGAIADKSSVITFDETVSGYLQATDTWTNGFGDADSDHLEARLSSKGDGPISWIVGLTRYTSDKHSNDATYQAGAADFINANPDLFGGLSGEMLAPGDFFTQYIVDQHNEDSAIFGEVTFNLSDSFSLTAGGRYFDTKSDTTVTRPPSATFEGVYVEDTVTYGGVSSENGFTPKFTGKYRPNDDFMLYATYSEGFRVGGVNPNPPGTTGSTASFKPDTTKNYEVGTRIDLMKDSLLLDATVFRIDWTDMQVRLFTPAPLYLAYNTNAGAAQINGIEFSAAWRPTSMLDLNTNITYLDAEISEFLPDTFAAGGGYEPGTTLPGSSKWTIANNVVVNLDDIIFAPRLTFSHRYLSEAPVAFNSVTQRGGFSIYDIRADFAVMENVDVAIYAENIFDQYGVLNAPFGDYYPTPVGTVPRPRSFGVKLAWHMF